MSGRDHSETCAFCSYERGGIMHVSCACDDLVASSNMSGEYAGRVRAVAEERDAANAELAQLREEVAKLRPVFEAAVEWRSHHFTAFQISADKLKRAIDAAESGR